ncbi:MAG: Sir2 family NAD-dependent protein deacetylase [Chloroflexota bacterium]|nr:Sir2 family NAD-dependent protein deacetylase [Chloroflexota bacterium]
MTREPTAGVSPVRAPDSGSSAGIVDQPALTALVHLASERPRIVAFTGAGISTDSGIPDYRGPNGVWKRQTPLTVQAFANDPATRRGYWARRRLGYSVMADAVPNSGHRALATLEGVGRLRTIITQNIDGLHQKAGNDPGRVIELHGTTHSIVCVDCGARTTGAEIQRWLEANDGIPACAVCGGTLRPATILFGEPLSPPVWAAAIAAVEAADLLLIVGSSLVVNPAASLPLLAKQRGAAVAIINRESTPLDELADVVFHGNAGPALGAFVTTLTETIPDQESGAG